MNLRPSGYESDTANFMVFSRHQASRDFGLLSTTDADLGYLQERQLADSVTSAVIWTRAEASQNRHPKSPSKITIQKRPSNIAIQKYRYHELGCYTPIPRCPCAAYTV